LGKELIPSSSMKLILRLFLGSIKIRLFNLMQNNNTDSSKESKGRSKPSQKRISRISKVRGRKSNAETRKCRCLS